MTPAELNAHIKEVYDITLLTCPSCWKAFSTYDSPLMYINYNVHISKDVRICPICNYKWGEHDFPDLFY